MVEEDFLNFLFGKQITNLFTNKPPINYNSSKNVVVPGWLEGLEANEVFPIRKI